jgi:hypothetical protein
MPIFVAGKHPDGEDAELVAFGTPDPDNPKVWFEPCVPRWYAPLLVEVEERTDTAITFWILRYEDGERAHEVPILENLKDAERVYDLIPSTIADADPSDEDKRYGFLFVSERFLDWLETNHGIDSHVVTRGKWPHGSAELKRAIEKLLARTPNGPDALLPAEQSAIDALLRYLAP